MTQTKYPISKIRSGEVAVKLTSLEQFKKIAPEQSGVHDYVEGLYHTYFDGKLTWMAKEYTSGNECEETLIDFSQIDWEEVKEETVEEAIKREYEARKFNSDFPFEPQSFKIGAKWQKEQLDKELSSLKAENERLKRDMGDITRKNVELVLENETLSSKNATLAANYFESYQQLQQQQTSQSQELSLRQRMAWEYLKENPQVGVEKSFKYIDNFLNYKGGNDEQ
jgi:hypothetical protein